MNNFNEPGSPSAQKTAMQLWKEEQEREERRRIVDPAEVENLLTPEELKQTTKVWDRTTNKVYVIKGYFDLPLAKDWNKMMSAYSQEGHRFFGNIDREYSRYVLTEENDCDPETQERIIEWNKKRFNAYLKTDPQILKIVE